MKNTFLGKLLSKRGQKQPFQESAPFTSAATFGDLAPGTDFRQDAFQRTKREAPVGGRVADQVASQYPELEWYFQKLRSSYEEFAETGITSGEGYLAFRHLYFATRGISNETISQILSEIFPKPPLPATISSAFGTFTGAEVKTMVEYLRQNAVIEVNGQLDSAHTRELAASVGFLDLDEKNGTDSGPLISVPESKLLSNPLVCQLACDPLFYFLSSEYLNCEPVLLHLVARFSTPHDNSYEHLDNAAQLFHVDMSVPKFLHGFVYLNDVGENNGAHCMIPGTHREKHPALWHDGRINDNEMANYYPEETWKKATGPAGSCFVVDTASFHRGTAPVHGVRKALLLAWTNTLFGEHQSTEPGSPEFRPENFGPQTSGFSPRFLSRFAMGLS
jgi:hypothetical protein